MAAVSRVPGPGSPFSGRSGRVIGLVALGIGLALAKPWDGPPPRQAPPPAVRPVLTATAIPVAATIAYDPASFGVGPPAPAWELWTPDRPTSIRFVGPADGFVPPTVAPGAPGVVGGPVIEIGSSDDATAIAINRPRDARLATVRLWRFRDGEEPERVALSELPPPWPSDSFRVFALRDPRLAAGTILRWRPGLYRLDLLIDPADSVRSLLLIVRDGIVPLPAPVADPEPSEVDLQVLGRLPDAATLWSYGTFLTGWADRLAGDCRVTEIWRATDPDDPCRPVPVGQAGVLGVNIANGDAVTAIRLREVDPLPKPIEVEARLAVIGRPGLAFVSTERPVLADGIYRLDVETTAGQRRWYVEAGLRSIQWGG